MYSVWLKISISNNSCQYSFVITSVAFIIDRVTTQHKPKCGKNCYVIVSLTFTRVFVRSVCNSKNGVFFISTVDKLFCYESVFDRDALRNNQVFCLTLSDPGYFRQLTIGQNGQSCQEICKCNNFHLFTINRHKF